MIPSTFDYIRVNTVEEALHSLSEEGEDAKLLAGGHSLLPLLKLRLASPTVLIDISRMSELSFVSRESNVISIGALTTHADIHSNETLRDQCPILAHAAGQVGDRQVRNRGTIGGSIVHADPSADLPAVLLALDAQLVVRGPEGQRIVPARDFFQGLFEVDLAPDEMLVEIWVPQATEGWSYEKFRARAQDWAMVGVAVVGTGDDRLPARVALASMGDTPLRATAVEEVLAAGMPVAEAARQVVEGTSPPSDQKATAGYRKHLATVLTRRALENVVGISR